MVEKNSVAGCTRISHERSLCRWSRKSSCTRSARADQYDDSFAVNAGGVLYENPICYREDRGGKELTFSVIFDQIYSGQRYIGQVMSQCIRWEMPRWNKRWKLPTWNKHQIMTPSHGPRVVQLVSTLRIASVYKLWVVRWRENWEYPSYNPKNISSGSFTILLETPHPGLIYPFLDLLPVVC